MVRASILYQHCIDTVSTPYRHTPHRHHIDNVSTPYRHCKGVRTSLLLSNSCTPTCFELFQVRVFQCKVVCLCNMHMCVCLCVRMRMPACKSTYIDLYASMHAAWPIYINTIAYTSLCTLFASLSDRYDSNFALQLVSLLCPVQY